MTTPPIDLKWLKRLLPFSLALSGGTALYSANLPEQFYGVESPEDSLGYQLLHAYDKGQERMTASPKYGSFKFGSAKSPTTVKNAAAFGKYVSSLMGGVGDIFKSRGSRAGAQEALTALRGAGTKIDPKTLAMAEGALAEAASTSKALPYAVGGLATLGAGAAIADPLFDIAQPYIDAKGYELARRNTDIMTRAKMDQLAAESFAKTLGSEAAMGLTGLLGGTVDAATAIPRQRQYGDLFSHLLDTDPIIGMATPEQQALMGSAYESMQKVAPTIASDPFATKNYLREVMVTGNGPDHATLGNLAKSEESIRGRGGR